MKNDLGRPAWTVRISAFALGAAAALAGAPPRADETIVPPPGDYQMVDLCLKSAGDRNADLTVRGGTRNGKIPMPSNLSVRDILGEMTVGASSIKGVWIQPSWPPKKFALTATIAGGKVDGQWESEDGKGKGAIIGAVKTEAELRKENAFVTKSAWPCWSGPFTSMAVAPCGLKLVEDFNKEARLVWRSEEISPQGTGNSLNYNQLALVSRTCGGGSSLVVADGKVFIHYYQPSGSEYMKDYTGRGVDVLEELAKKAKPPIPEVTRWMKEKYLIKADDVVVCMDAVTGKTLWKNVFVEKSMNQPSHKGGANNNTPCVGGGRVFAMGPGGTLHGIDVATAKVLWERTGMSAEKVAPWSGARNMCNAPIYAAGTLILPDHGSTLYGINPETGKDLWKLPGTSYGFQVPAKWVHQRQEYVISMTPPNMSRLFKEGAFMKAVCLEPKTGKTLWEIDLPPNPNKGVSVFGDTMVVTAAGIVPKDFKGFPQDNSTTRTNAAGTITAYRLNLQKAEQVWQSPATHAAGDAPPAINGKYAVVGGPKESHLYDAATGKDLATYSGMGPFNEGHTAFVEDRVILSIDGSHGSSAMVILGATPETFGKPLCTWSQPHPQTTSYHNKYMTFPMVEGRIFMRGYDGVYCYDLRKK